MAISIDGGRPLTRHRDGKQSEIAIGGALPDIVDVIETSWDRCVSLHNLDRSRKEGPSVLTSAELKAAADPLDTLMRVARPHLVRLMERLAPAKHIVALSDPNGIALDVQTSMPLDRALVRMGVCSGATWGEQHVGTNGIGTSIASRRAVTVHRQHHFLLRYADLTCTAAPVFDCSGRVIAALDASSVADLPGEVQVFVLDLVMATTQRIQEDYFLERHRDHHVVSVHPCIEGSGGTRFMVAFGDDGLAMDVMSDAPDGVCPPQLAAFVGQKLNHVLDANWQDGTIKNERTATTERIGVVRFQGQAAPFFGRMTLPRTRPRMARAALDQPIIDVSPQPAQRPSKFIGLNALAGNDPVVRAHVATIRKCVDRRMPILLQGETGTGKEEFARAIHASSARAARPFVAIDCSSIPESLIESELFGYEPGSFTGARREGRPGRILEANGGTLFLDEIGDMPLPLQTRLLRVLALNEIAPLGSAKTVTVDFALVSASHQNLEALIAQGRFRQDLFYRLAGARLTLPALRERQDKEDVILNALKLESADAGLRPSTAISDQALRRLIAHTWPGNIRELRLALRYAVTMAAGDDLTLAHLPTWLDSTQGNGTGLPRPAHGADHMPDALAALPPASIENQLRAALERCDWCISSAAQDLGVSRQTIYRWLKRHNMSRPASH